MVDDLVGYVADLPPAVDQAPDQVHVLAEPQAGVEAGTECRGPGHQGGRRDVGDRPARPHQALVGPEVEGGPAGRVPRPHGAPGPDVGRRPHPGGHRPDPAVGEPRHHRGGPARGGDAVAVDEGHEPGAHRGQAVVARRRRATGGVPPHQGGARTPADLRHGPGIEGPVVHDDGGHPGVEGGQAAGQGAGPVPDRDDHGDPVGVVPGAGPTRRPGVGQSGVDQAPPEAPRTRPGLAPGQQAGQLPSSVGGEPQDPSGHPAHQHRAAGAVPAHPGVEDQAPAFGERGAGTVGRHSGRTPGRAVGGGGDAGDAGDGAAGGGAARPGHRPRPPSTGSTAPVIPPVPTPASHTRAAAISSGSSRRPTTCWSAKASRESRP